MPTKKDTTKTPKLSAPQESALEVIVAAGDAGQPRDGWRAKGYGKAPGRALGNLQQDGYIKPKKIDAKRFADVATPKGKKYVEKKKVAAENAAARSNT